MSGMRALGVAAIASSVIVLGLPETAEACTCFPGVSVVYPQSGGTIPADGVMVVTTNDPSWPQSTPLLDSTSAEVPVAVVAEHAQYGACLGLTQLVKPQTPLTVGASYSCDVATFTAGDPVGTVTSDVSLAIELVEHAAESTLFHYCASAVDVTKSAGVSLSFTSPNRVLLVLQTRATPAGGTTELVHGGSVAVIEPASPRSAKGHHRAVAFVPDAPEGCAHAWVYDLTGSLLAEHDECFELQAADAGTSDDGGLAQDGAAGGGTRGDSAGCRTRGGRTDGFPWLGLLLLVIAARRRSVAHEDRARPGALFGG